MNAGRLRVGVVVHARAHVAAYVVVALGIAACESGTLVELDVTLSDGAAAAGTAEAPALLATDVQGAVALVAMCGQDIGATSFARDVDFSCAPRGDEANVVVHAWVEPLPDGLDAERFCALSSSGDGIDLAGAVVDDGGVPTPSLARATHEGSVEATWQRDLSPCGGKLSAAVHVE